MLNKNQQDHFNLIQEVRELHEQLEASNKLNSQYRDIILSILNCTLNEDDKTLIDYLINNYNE